MTASNNFKMSLSLALAAICLSTIVSNAGALYVPQKTHTTKSWAEDPLQADASEELPVMEHNNNFDTIMPDYYDNHPSASMQYQNFEKFFDAQVAGGANAADSEYKMDESQFLRNAPAVREPQQLTAEERRIRQKLADVDTKRERKIQLKLKKGSTKPRGAGAPQWDQFDYDLYSVDPASHEKNSVYGYF